MPRFRRLKVYSPEMTATVSHTPEGHLSATRQYNRTLITTVHWQKNYNGQRKKEKTFLNLMHFCQTNTHFFWTGKGREGREKCCNVWQETKTESRDEREKLIPKNVPRAQVPFSVKKLDFVPLSQAQQARKTIVFFFSVRTFYSLKLFKRRGDFLVMQFSPVPKVLFSRSAWE